MEEERILAEIKISQKRNPKSGQYEIDANVNFKVVTAEDLEYIQYSLLDIIENIKAKRQ